MRGIWPIRFLPFLLPCKGQPFPPERSSRTFQGKSCANREAARPYWMTQSQRNCVPLDSLPARAVVIHLTSTRWIIPSPNRKNRHRDQPPYRAGVGPCFWQRRLELPATSYAVCFAKICDIFLCSVIDFTIIKSKTLDLEETQMAVSYTIGFGNC